MYIVAILIFLLVCFAMFYASYSISLGVYVKSFCKNRNAVRCVALSFDDGIDEENTPKVLDVLARYGVKATFFVIGEKAAMHPEILKRIVDEGHEIGNHTMSHGSTFPMMGEEKMVAEIEECSAVIERITKQKVKYFRPPFGVTNPPLARAIKRMGLESIGWSIRSLDTMERSIEKTEERVMQRIGHGDVILLHDDRAGADILTEKIIGRLLAKEYRIITIAELIEIK